MSELNRAEQLAEAIDLLEYLDTDGMVRRTAYSVADLRRIQRLWRGEGER